MKNLICSLCIWTLRKLKVSCIIAMKCEGGTISGLNRYTYWYDCNFTDVKTTDKYSTSIDLSKQPFTITTYPNEL